MKWSYPAWCLAAALVIFGPVGWRVLCWERPKPQPVEADMAAAGEVLFKHEWQPNDSLSPNGDGLGPVFNAASCVACHHQNGVGGSGGVAHNVTTFAVLPRDGFDSGRQGVLHAQAVLKEHQETLAMLDPTLPATAKLDPTQIAEIGNRRRSLCLPNNVQLAQRNTTALFGLGLIDQIPDRVIVAGERQQRLAQGMAKGEASEKAVVGRVHRLSDGRIGRFGWKAHVATLSDFVQVACANELGLGNPGHAQPASLAQVTYQPPGLDLTQQQCDQLTSFISTLPRPVEVLSAKAEAGKAHFAKTGCADCHTPNLGSVSGLYSDLLMHRMGQTLEGGGSYGAPIRTTPTSPSASDPLPDEWRTPPLWGVADSAPYMHDGRAATLEEAISMHGGQAAAAAGRFAGLAPREQQELVAFLRSLRAP